MVSVSEQTAAFVIQMIAGILNGMASSPFWNIGISFLDDITGKQSGGFIGEAEFFYFPSSWIKGSYATEAFTNKTTNRRTSVALKQSETEHMKNVSVLAILLANYFFSCSHFINTSRNDISLIMQQLLMIQGHVKCVINVSYENTL